LWLIIGFALFLISPSGTRIANCDHTIGRTEDLEEYIERGTPEASTGISLAPILAYEPSFGVIFGGASFFERPFDPRYRLFTRVTFTTNSEYGVTFDLKRWYREDKFYQLQLDLDDYARPYYGEGMNTSASENVLLEGTVGRIQFYLKGRRGTRITSGPFIDYRGTDPKGVDGTDITPPEYKESTLSLGFSLNYDSRDSNLSPTSGYYNALTVRIVPDFLSTYQESETFLQAEGDLRAFRSIGEGLVLAGRFYAGGSWGTPSYQFRYSLGGPYLLRGFFTNRFRGDKFYVAQGELRKHLLLIGSGVVFAEIGEVTDDRFESPRTSYGFGLRVTLPPDNVAKARVDLAWSEDQQSIYFVFGEAF
jgi:outer membrane protein assembly factor BamA